MPRSIDVEVKLGMLRAQIGEPGKEALRGVERQDAEPEAQHLDPARHRLHRVGQAVERGRDLRQQPLAVTVELHRLMAAIEQGAADEEFERLDAAAARGRRQREFLRPRLARTETGDLDESRIGSASWRERGWQ